MNSWVSTYGWSDVFAFVDANKDFLNTGVPRYLVVNPADSTVVYDGGNINAAQNAVTTLLASIGINETDLKQNTVVYQSGNEIRVEGIDYAGLISGQLYDLSGRRVKTWESLEDGAFRVQSDLLSGLYILQLEVDGIPISKKIHLEGF